MAQDSESSDPDAAPARIRLGDIDMAFRRSGEGRPVVFVHGLAEDGASWSDVVARLPGGLEAFCIDLRGHGASSAGKGAGSAAQLADDLTAFMEAVTGPAICVGFSLGGVVVLEAALRRPDLVRKAIAVGASSKVGRAACAVFEERIAQLRSDREAFRRALEADTQAQLFRNRALAESVARRRMAAVGDGEGFVNASRAMIAMAGEPMTERLAAMRVPVRVIQGAQDAFCPRKAAEIMLSSMPHASFSEIPEAGHLMAVDQPGLLAAHIAEAARI